MVNSAQHKMVYVDFTHFLHSIPIIQQQIPKKGNAMNKNILDRAHQLILRMPSLLEKVVAAILLLGVVYSCIQLGLHVGSVTELTFEAYIEDILLTAFNAVLVIEFIRMLIKHSMNTIVEVLIFAIARGLVVGHEAPVETLVRIACIAILLACRKYLFYEKDFEEEL